MKRRLTCVGRTCSTKYGIKRALHTNIMINETIIPEMKYTGGSIMILGCFATPGPGRVHRHQGENYSQVYQGALQDTARVDVCQPKLSRSWVMTLNIEVNLLQNDFKLRKSASWSVPLRVQTLTQQRCCGMRFTPWSLRIIPSEYCAGLICSYQKSLFFAAKSGLTSY